MNYNLVLFHLNLLITSNSRTLETLNLVHGTNEISELSLKIFKLLCSEFENSWERISQFSSFLYLSFSSKP